MNYVKERERRSKVYMLDIHDIPLNKDNEHQKISPVETEQTKYVQQKKNIDKIMLGIVKERMFGTFLNQDSKVSPESYYNVDLMSKQLNNKKNRLITYRSKDLSSNYPSVELSNPKSRPYNREQFYTIEVRRSDPYNVMQTLESSRKRRSYSRKLPKLTQLKPQKLTNKKLQYSHQKKLDINEKPLGQRFKKLAGISLNNQTIYDFKISRETIINSYKNIVDGEILERFFHFFNFPQTFGLRHYCNLIENAVNCSMKFIYFWVFALFDENANGILQSQDLFRFLQRFPVQNQYIEQQVYRIQRYLMQVEKNFKPKDEKDLVEQTLVVNHNLKLDELRDLLKQSQKERIEVSCVKNTCYHQTVMSIQHGPLQRQKLDKIEANELQTRKRKKEMIQIKKKLQNTPGLRLRDFYVIFGLTKRPRIFCYFVSLLTGENGELYQ